MTRIDLLTREYELCQNSVQKKDTSIWQTFAVLGVVYSAGLGMLSQTSPSLLAAAAISILVIASAWIWWNMACRWWDLQMANILRMTHIEEDLKYIYQVRYVRYLDGQLKVSQSDVPKKRWNILQEIPTFKKRGVKGSLQYFPPIVTIVWAVYFVSLVVTKQNQQGGQAAMLATMEIPIIVFMISTILGGLGVGLFIGILVGGKRRNQISIDAIAAHEKNKENKKKKRQQHRA